MANKLPTVFVAGHRGMVGSAIVRLLESRQNCQIIVKNRDELDLLDQQAVNRFFESENIDEIYLAAARVGGIHANDTYPAEFIYQNILIQSNIIHAAHQRDINRLLFLGSSCIYPKFAVQPIPETELLTGTLEPTNEPYAVAKIAGIKMCEAYNRQYGRDYRSVMPTNLYGPGDNFHPSNSHVIPGLIRKFHEALLSNANSVSIWGSGKVMREFLYVDDMADACCHLMQIPESQYSQGTDPRMSHINIGTGVDCTIAELAEEIKAVSGFNGKLEYDSSMPDGTPRKLLDVRKIGSFGWHAKTPLRAGLEATWNWYLKNI